MKPLILLKKILLHSMVSIIFLCLPIIFSPDILSGLGLFSITPFLYSFSRQVLLLFFLYGNYYFLLPRLYFKNFKYAYFLLILLISIIVILIPSLLFPIELKNHNFQHNINTSRPTIFFKPSPESGIIQLSLIIISSFLFRISQLKNQIENEKKEVEISFLRMQINPHFLFNSLNTIYALAIKKDDKTADAIVHLASLMRFIMSESQKETIEVNQEISYIKSYVQLQKSRFGFTSLVDYDIKESSTKKTIAPLILIPFVENAFQYGINPNEVSSVFIKIEVVDATLLFVAKNTIVARSIEGNKIGLQNTIRRLNLIYPNQHILEIKNSGTHYTVNLSIQLI